MQIQTEHQERLLTVKMQAKQQELFLTVKCDSSIFQRKCLVTSSAGGLRPKQSEMGHAKLLEPRVYVNCPDADWQDLLCRT